MEQIIIPNITQNDLIKILGTLCINIQTEFDISPKILNIIIHKKNFIEYCQFLYQQYYGEMINNIDMFKENFNKNIEITDGEYEKCGYLLTSYQNTYISYCNLHKYLHPHPNLQDPNANSDIEHTFVTKNNTQIIRERYMTFIHLIYQSFINKIYHKIKQLFIYLMNISCDQKIVKISDDLSDIINNMKHDDTLFKSKIIYEHLVQTTDKYGENNINNKFYYIKLYKLHQE